MTPFGEIHCTKLAGPQQEFKLAPLGGLFATTWLSHSWSGQLLRLEKPNAFFRAGGRRTRAFSTGSLS